MEETEAIVRRVDHILARVNEPEPLFSTLTQKLLLPEAWPVTTNPFYTSGGIYLGNLNLEVIQVGRQVKPARLYGIALEMLPFEQSLPELDQRGIPHTPPMPFYLVDDQGWQVTAWVNVYLGGLLSNSALKRIFFRLSHQASKDAWEQTSVPSPRNRRFGLPMLYNRFFRDGMILAVQHNPAWYAARVAQEPAAAGLEVQQVYEVTVGVRDYERAHSCWKRLLEPHPEIAAGVWRLPDGMHLRLIHSRVDGMRRMIWRVASLNRAVQFLHKRDMLGQERNGMPTINPKTIQGLDIRLVQ